MAGILDGKSALITGAGSGIGRATAKIFAREGASLVLADIMEAGGQETVQMVKGMGAEAETHGLLQELLSYPDVPRHWRTLDLDASTAPFLPIQFSKDGLSLRYFPTLTTLGTPHDITLQELRVESFFPADEATEDASRRLEMGGIR